MLRISELVIGQRVLEFGAGTGFLGIVVAALQLLAHESGCGAVYMTDISEFVLQRCHQNVRLPCSTYRAFCMKVEN